MIASPFCTEKADFSGFKRLKNRQLNLSKSAYFMKLIRASRMVLHLGCHNYQMTQNQGIFYKHLSASLLEKDQVRFDKIITKEPALGIKIYQKLVIDVSGLLVDFTFWQSLGYSDNDL
jgi:hypothetical protein